MSRNQKGRSQPPKQSATFDGISADATQSTLESCMAIMRLIRQVTEDSFSRFTLLQRITCDGLIAALELSIRIVSFQNFTTLFRQEGMLCLTNLGAN